MTQPPVPAGREVADDMPEHGVPVFLSVGDRPAHYIGWVGDHRMVSLAALLRSVADTCDDPRLRR